MSVLDELDLSEARGLLALHDDSSALTAVGHDALVRAVFAAAIWEWWNQNRSRVVQIGWKLLLRALLLRRPIKWEDLRDWILELVGPPPADLGAQVA